MDEKKTIFLTGATGLVGSYLLKILLQNGHKVFCLSRCKKDKTARQRVEDVLNFWDETVLAEYKDKLVVLEGDITLENLGLDEQTRDILKNEVVQIFHSAAVTEFNLSFKDLYDVNVGGTKRVLDLAAELKNNGKFEKINHISTVYVCGDHKGDFAEDDLDVGQNFNTGYGQSKFEAEKLVEEYREKGIWIDIFRPPMIVGESTTGKTFLFDQAFYQTIRILKSEIFTSFPVEKWHKVNMVCVDELCQCVVRIAFKNNVKNQVFHVFSGKPLLVIEGLSIISDILNIKKPGFIALSEVIGKLTPVQKKLLEYNMFFLNNDVNLYSHLTNRFLEKYGFSFSEYDSVVFSNLVKHFLGNGA
ncbi:MAG: SDR family oxidoreductase [Candidatus Omnitrophota bacterium]